MYTSKSRNALLRREASLSRRRLVARQPAAGGSSGLTAQDVTDWLVLHRVRVAEPGVSTDPGLFYHAKGDVFVSDRNDSLTISPGAAVSFDTAFNLFGLGAMAEACRLGRLAMLVRGVGTVEVTLIQSQSGRTPQRVFTDIVTLSAGRDAVFDLDLCGLDQRDGVIWAELRAMDRERSLRVEAIRILTDAAPDPALRVALCRPLAEGATDPGLSRLLAWAEDHPGQVAILTTGAAPRPAASLIALPAQPSLPQARQALLAEARARGFSHLLLTEAKSLPGPETLSRALTALSLLKPGQAFGAALLDSAEGWKLSNAGISAAADGKPVPLSPQADLRRVEILLDMLHEAAETASDGHLLPQTGFLGLATSALPEDLTSALVVTRTGAEPITSLAPGLVKTRLMPGLLLRAQPGPSRATGFLTLQNLIFPEANLCTEQHMFFHGPVGVEFDRTQGVITVAPQALCIFDTYFNCLSIGKWHAACTLNGLWLGISGRGKVSLKVFHAMREKSWEVLANTVITLSRTEETLIDLSHYPDNGTDGVIFFEVLALGEGVQISGARFLTEGAVDPSIRLALSITTFKREAQVENTARRFAAYFDRAEYAAQMDCFIVDNGDSAKIIAHPKIRRIPNRNLGGSGGFTRGLLEAEAQGYSHIVFMDDDASIPLEALGRTYVFLLLAKNPKAAVAGAMINTTDKWRMCENGAIFDQKCYPQFAGTDLRLRDDVFRMEFESARRHSPKMYGGWWFFAFKVDQVTRHPFPFFVRGDDVNFSLVNEFRITTLNGVVSFADDFVDKESPMTWYLDLRSHMVHHLTLDKMEIGRFKLAAIGLSFWRRNVVKFQYETMEAVLLAWEHVLQGPDFFTSNPDAASSRAAVKALTQNESFKELGDLSLTHKAGFLDRHLRLRRKFYPLSLNGHLLPFYRLWGSRRVIPAWQRGHIDAMWGSEELVFLNSAQDKAYVTRRDNWRFLKLTGRLISIWVRTVGGYDALRALYRKRYPEITTQDYWTRTLAPQPAAAEGAKTKAA